MPMAIAGTIWVVECNDSMSLIGHRKGVVILEILEMRRRSRAFVTFPG
jgi:hypothetical protein